MRGSEAYSTWYVEGLSAARMQPLDFLNIPRGPKWWNGRHARLRGVWRKPCGFKSRLRHHLFDGGSIKSLSGLTIPPSFLDKSGL